MVEKLGWGHFSTVWLAHDTKAKLSQSPEFVALKILKSASQYREAGLDEIDLLKHISGKSKSEEVMMEMLSLQKRHHVLDNILILLDNFDHNGPHGNHICLAFEILGENLLGVVKKYDYQGLPLSVVKHFTKQICQGLDFLHRHCSIIHTDLKLENILIQTPSCPDIPRYQSLFEAQQSNSMSTSATLKTTPSDSKKKLKKKAKKKKNSATTKSNSGNPSNMASNDSKKKKARRRKRRGGKKGSKSPSTAVRREEIAMEKDSSPAEKMELLEYHNSEAKHASHSDSVESKCDAKCEAKSNAKYEAKASFKGTGMVSVSDSMLSSPENQRRMVDSKGNGEDLDDFNDVSEDHESSSHSLPSKHKHKPISISISTEILPVMTSQEWWKQRNLFTFLNFMTPSLPSSLITTNSTSSCGVSSQFSMPSFRLVKEYSSPPSFLEAKISMVCHH